MSQNFKNADKCKPCDNWNSGDGNESVAWSACSPNGKDVYLQPELSGGQGYFKIDQIQHAMNTYYPENPGQIIQSKCMKNYNGYDNINKDCDTCFKSAPIYENYKEPNKHLPPYYCNQSKKYKNLNECWSNYPPYTLN